LHHLVEGLSFLRLAFLGRVHMPTWVDDAHIRFLKDEDVFTLTVRGTSLEVTSENIFLRDLTDEAMQFLRVAIASEVEQVSEGQLRLESVSLRRGSIELVVTVAAIFEIIVHWETVWRKATRLAGRIASVMNNHLPFALEDIHVLPTEPARERPIREVATRWPALLAWYLIASNAVMLGVLVWLVLRS
jgi:hypothetical protein